MGFVRGQLYGRVCLGGAGSPVSQLILEDHSMRRVRRVPGHTQTVTKCQREVKVRGRGWYCKYKTGDTTDIWRQQSHYKCVEATIALQMCGGN